MSNKFSAHLLDGFVDWTIPNKGLKQLYGVSDSVISKARKRYAPDTIGTFYAKVDWSGVNWSESLRVIAAKMGVTYQAVAYHKRAMSKRKD